MQYLFELGHQPHISIAELESVFSGQKIKHNIISKENKYIILEADKLDVEKLINQLGGTIKIGTAIKQTGDDIKTISSFLNKNNEGKIHFSVPDKKLGLSIKKELKSLGRSVRYVEAKNAATILHNNLIEKQGDFTIVNNKIFVTIALQPFEEMSKRDYDRPGSDDFSGMLPPKLAKIMINLSGINPKQALLDPFCGSGTILTEALAMGHKNIFGSDVSEKAISDTEKNLEWLIQEYDLDSLDYQLIESDAVKLNTELKSESIDAIISEPYMGKTLRGSETREQLEEQAHDLGKLYINSFKSLHKILKKNGMVIFIIPQFKHKDEWVRINCIEEIIKIGFELLPFEKNKSLLSTETTCRKKYLEI